MKNKIDETLTFLLPLQLIMIDIVHSREDEGGMCSCKRGDPAEGSASAPPQNIKR
jgi:hypothetical protein